MRFEIDDIAISTKGSVILAKGKRRIALNKLSDRQVELLMSGARSRTLPDSPDTRALVAKLRQVDFPFETSQRRWPSLRLHSRTVVELTRPLSALARPLWLALFLVAGVLGAGHVMASAGSVDIMSLIGGEPMAIAGFVLTSWAIIAIHEAGHAAACLRATGMVGGVRLKLHWGMPAVATDVSAIAMARPQDRKWINLAGPAWHMAASLLIYYASVEAFPPAALAAATILPVAFFALLPLPGFDGFWVLQDLTRCRIAGPLRMPRRGDVLAPIYCWLLLVVIPALIMISVYFIYQGLMKTISGVILLAALVSLVSVVGSLFGLYRFLFPDER